MNEVEPTELADCLKEAVRLSRDGLSPDRLTRLQWSRTLEKFSEQTGWYYE